MIEQIVDKITWALLWFCSGIVFKIIVDEINKKKEINQLNKKKR